VKHDSCPPHLEDTDLVTLHLPSQLFEVQFKQLDRLKLMAPEKYMSAEGEAATSARRIRIVRYQNRIAIIGVGSNSIVVRPTKAGIDHAPTLMSALSKKRTYRLSIDVLIEHKAHLRNR
jgi:hypothetical protein